MDHGGDWPSGTSTDWRHARLSQSWRYHQGAVLSDARRFAWMPSRFYKSQRWKREKLEWRRHAQPERLLSGAGPPFPSSQRRGGRRPGWSVRRNRGFAGLTTPSAPLRWLRSIFLVAHPPLLCEEGNTLRPKILQKK